MPNSPLLKWSQHYPLGLIIIALMGIVSSVFILLRDTEKPAGLELWLFNREHQEAINEFSDDWVAAGGSPVNVRLMDVQALERRMLAGFFGGIPTADILQMVGVNSSQAWRGPLDAVGFTDITERLHSSGFYQKIVPAAFSAYTVKGHIFGIPQDIHPVLLTYRADIYEAAGIDVSQLDTWEAFMQASLPLIGDLNGDGTTDRFVLELSEVDFVILITMMLQTGAPLFDDQGQPLLNQTAFVEVLSQMANWASRPNKITESIDLYSGPGHRLRSDGLVLAWLTPDWRSRAMELYSPALAGKVKVMPLPAWKPGGLRTSVMGGTMIGFPKSSTHFDESWQFIESLFSNRDIATSYWTKLRLLTPIREFWDDPVYDQPNAFYSNQPTGRLYIEQADNVPSRTSSVYFSSACNEILNAFNRLIRYAEAMQITDAISLQAEAAAQLNIAQQNVLRQMQRNIFQQPPANPK